MGPGLVTDVGLSLTSALLGVGSMGDNWTAYQKSQQHGSDRDALQRGCLAARFHDTT
jgi:hypothetical protein